MLLLSQIASSLIIQYQKIMGCFTGWTGEVHACLLFKFLTAKHSVDQVFLNKELIWGGAAVRLKWMSDMTNIEFTLHRKISILNKHRNSKYVAYHHYIEIFWSLRYTESRQLLLVSPFMNKPRNFSSFSIWCAVFFFSNERLKIFS